MSKIQYKQVGSSLREELMKAKTDLKKASQSLEIVTKEKNSKEASANSLLIQSTSSEEEIQKFKKEEKILRETISKLEANQGALTTNVQVKRILSFK